MPALAALLLAGAVALAGDPAPRDAELDALRAELQALRQAVEVQGAETRALREQLADPGAAPGRSGPGAEPRRSARVGQERVAFGAEAHVRPGEVVDDVVAFGGRVRIEGVVRGDATAVGGDVWLLDGAVVEGDAIAFGGRVRIEDGARVLGDRVTLDGPVRRQPARSVFADLYHRVVLFLSFAGAGVLVVGLFPHRVERVARCLDARPLWSGVLGATLGGLFTVFSLLFALLTLGLGAPVSLLAMGLLGAAWLLGFVGLCQAVGDRLPFAEKAKGRWLTFLVGTALLSCLGSLPWVGWMVFGSASLAGIGAAFGSRFGGR